MAGTRHRYHCAHSAESRTRRSAHARANPRRDIAHCPTARRSALRRLPATNRRLDEDHQRRAEKAGARDRCLSQQARRNVGRGRSSPARRRGPQAHRSYRRGTAAGRFLAGIARSRHRQRRGFPAAGGQARPALRAICLAAFAHLAGSFSRRIGCRRTRWCRRARRAHHGQWHPDHRRAELFGRNRTALGAAHRTSHGAGGQPRKHPDCVNRTRGE